MTRRQTWTSRGLSHSSSAPDLPGATDAPPWLVDDYLETYVWWREECAGVHRTYELLDSVEREDRWLAYAAYEAALDREERAAHSLRERLLRLLR